jgi:hypothetical protein
MIAKSHSRSKGRRKDSVVLEQPKTTISKEIKK